MSVGYLELGRRGGKTQIVEEKIRDLIKGFTKEEKEQIQRELEQEIQEEEFKTIQFKDVVFSWNIPPSQILFMDRNGTLNDMGNVGEQAVDVVKD